MEKAVLTTEECKGIEAFLNEIECKRIDPEKEIEIQKWILKMTLEAV